MLAGEKQVWFRRCRTIWFLKRNCPHVWALLNQQAQRDPPKGVQDYLSGIWRAEGQAQLRLADARLSNLIVKTSERRVADTYRRDISGVDTENKLAELLCEITLVDALAGISSVPPELRPAMKNGRQCDVKVVVEGMSLYGEVKRFADAWEGGARSIAKSPPGEKPPDTSRPRAMDLVSKLKEVYTQFPQQTLNVLFLFHSSVWNSPVYIKQALFGDASGFDDSQEPFLRDDGLFALHEWREVSACAHSRVNPDGNLSVVQIWRNPNAHVSLPDNVRERLALAG